MPATSLHESLEKQPSVDQNIGPLAPLNHRMMARRDPKNSCVGAGWPNQLEPGISTYQRASCVTSILIIIWYDWRESLGELLSLSVSACRVHFFSVLNSNSSSADSSNHSHVTPATTARGLFDWGCRCIHCAWSIADGSAHRQQSFPYNQIHATHLHHSDKAFSLFTKLQKWGGFLLTQPLLICTTT